MSQTPQSAHHHRVDYLEMPATDVARTRDFYAAVFGWKFTDYGPDYTAFEDGRLTGGFTNDRKPAPGVGPLVVLYSRALEATQAAVTKAGGRVTKEIFSFPGGRRFHFADPSGNELAVWSE